MALYYFDAHDGDHLVIDDIGLEFPSLETVKIEAARGLADLAKDVLPDSLRRELAIVVRDERSRHVLTTILVFEILILISNAPLPSITVRKDSQRGAPT